MDAFLSLVVFVALVVGLLWLTSLSRRIRLLEEDLRRNAGKAAGAVEGEVAALLGLRGRIEALERQLARQGGAGAAEQAAAPAPAPAPATAAPATATPVAPATPTTSSGQRDRTPSVPPEQVAATAPVEPARRVEPVLPLAATVAPATAPPAPPGTSVQPPRPAAPAEPAEAESWELVVGTSWLNKLGVLVFVVGVALLVGYSMAHVGPAGRVLIGYVLSAALLVSGIVFERRPVYRNYAYGLIAGGWAATYFTTYAMHAVDAARIVTSDVVGTTCLAAVAVGMIVHSLKYRSQATTALAYVVAYATLVLTPLSGFSLVASLPLAISVLVVGQRFGWSNVSVLGLASTYLLFVVRGHGYGDMLLEPRSSTPYLMIGAYWLTFEIADLTGLRHRGNEIGPLFALNAIGALGAGFTELPPGDAALWSWFLAGFGVLYLASAIVRARLMPTPATEPGGRAAAAFTSVHGAVVLAAALTATSIAVRFAGPREVVALLVETELLVAAGIVLHDRYVRWTGSGLGALVTLAAWNLVTLPAGTLTGIPGSPLVFTPAVALVAAAWYANRESMRGRGLPIAWFEHGYTWAASVLALALIVREFDPRHVGLPVLLLAAVLVEAGFRRAREYRLQAYMAVFVAASFLIVPFGIERPVRDVWLILPAAVAVAAWLAFRLNGATPRNVELRLAAGAMTCLAALLLAIFEWQITAPHAIGPVWTITATGLLIAGSRWRVAPLRFLAYGWAIVGALRSFAPIAAPGAATPAEIAWMSLVIALLFAITLISRRTIRSGVEGGPVADVEDTVRLVLSITATVLLAALIIAEVRPTLVTLAWGLEGLGLLAGGFLARERVLRLSGLALLFVCILKLFVYDLSALAPLPRIFSFVVLGLVLLAVSWTYTRYRDQIRRYL